MRACERERDGAGPRPYYGARRGRDDDDDDDDGDGDDVRA